MDDSELLRDFATTGSEAAFSQLVGRHINLVYGAARRQARGDAHLADDVTQAVFIILARKAGSIRSGNVLPAWLLSTARYCASNALLREARRRKHEYKAAAMAQTICQDNDSFADERFDPSLDEALAKLGVRDRSAVAMRFLQGMSIREVGAKLGVSEEAAQKRVGRAIERLRVYFTRRGIAMESAALAGSLARQGAQVAPSALATLVVSQALGAGQSVSAAALIAKGAAKGIAWMQTKLAATATAAALVVVATSGAVVIKTSRPVSAVVAPPASQSAAEAPSNPMWQPWAPKDSPAITSSQFSNFALMPVGGDATELVNGIDPQVKRTTVPAGMIKSLSTDRQMAGIRAMKVVVAPYRGKRIRLSGYLKTEDAQFASLALQVFGPDRLVLACDVGSRPLTGTNDWTRYEIVTDVPVAATDLWFAAYLRGKGTLWVDSVELAVVGNDVQVTDDSCWHIWTLTPAKYHAELDARTQHNGKPTVCLSSVEGNKFEKNDWAVYDHNELLPAKFVGKRLRLTGTVKCEGVSGGSGISIRTWGPDRSILVRDDSFGHRPMRGTQDWTTYSVYVDVGKDAQGLCWGIVLNGSGKLWADDLHLEVVEKGGDL